MNRVKLGKTGLVVSEIGFGANTFGTTTTAADSQVIFNHCRDAGINLFDTADRYGDGESEKILGSCIADCRDQVVISTKTGSKPSGDSPCTGSSRRHITGQVEKSLRQLKTDRIDILFLHTFDPVPAFESVLKALDDLVRSGKVLHVGVSNWPAWRIALAIAHARHVDISPISVLQPMYSLVKRQAEVEIFPLACEQQLGVMAYSPQGAGLLTGRYLKNPAASGRLTEVDYYARRYRDPRYTEVASRFCAFARERGYTPGALAIKWAAAHPAVSAPLIGARTLSQLDQTLAGYQAIEMADALYRQITDLSFAPPPANDRLEEQSSAND
jgi:aryl-alcohol dehydrogenase-like predicted oxidoreductase